MKIAERESEKQLSTTLLNSASQGRTWQHPCSDTQHVSVVNSSDLQVWSNGLENVGWFTVRAIGGIFVLF